MLSGNPDSFAIWFDQVDFWSTEKFKNGCFGYFIGGTLIWSLRSTLGVDVNRLGLLYAMKNSVEDEVLFNLPIQTAYERLCMQAFPSLDSGAKISDFKHFVSAESLSDDGYYAFLVECGAQAKLILGSENDASSVRQVILERGEFQRVVTEAIRKFCV
jgi:hypothetical protein